MVISSLLRRRSRMLTALLSVAVGAAVLLGLISIYLEVPEQLGLQFRQYGANLIVTPGEDRKLTTADLEYLRSVVPETSIVGLAPVYFFNLSINEQPFSGAATDFEQMQKTAPYWGISGQLPQKSGEVLLGQEVSNRIRARAGDVIHILYSLHDEQGTSQGQRQTLTAVVSGILTTGSEEENFVYLTLEDVGTLTGSYDEFDLIEASLALNESDLQKAADTMAQNPLLHPRLVTRVASSEGRVLAKLQSLVWLTTLIIVLLTAVCVATTMMAAAAERRSEIGLKKALGASDNDIVKEFMSESVLLGILGGILGSLLGSCFAAYVTARVFGTTLLPSLPLCLGCLALCIIITVVSSTMPILRAAKVDPVIVLRGE